jgi:hypothetical protein
MDIPPVVAKDPAVILTLTKKIPGVIFPDALEGSPETKPLEDNAAKLQEMGLMFARDKNKDVILFNPEVIKPKEVKLAIDKGKIYELFPEYTELTGKAAGAGGANKPPPAAASLTPPSAQGLPQPPASVEKATQVARVTPPDIAPGASNVLGGLQARAI